MDNSLVTRIRKLHEAIPSGLHNLPSSYLDLFKNLIKEHVQQSCSGFEKTSLLSEIWDNGLNFKDKLAQLGEAGFLAQKHMAHIIGANPLEPSIALLDASFSIAQKVDARRIMEAGKFSTYYPIVLLNAHSGTLSDPSDKWPKRFANLGFIEYKKNHQFTIKDKKKYERFLQLD